MLSLLCQLQLIENFRLLLFLQILCPGAGIMQRGFYWIGEEAAGWG